VIIIIVYWLGKIPALKHWHHEQDVVLHTALAATTIQVLTRTPGMVVRVAEEAWRMVKVSGQNLSRATRRAQRWIAEHLEVGIRLRLGRRLAEET
jgi:hypothetical protein